MVTKDKRRHSGKANPDPCIVEVRFDDILWEVYVKVSEQIEYGKPVIELSWGWTAGFSDEELKQLADDSPRGHKTICTTLDSAERLRGKLTAAIELAKTNSPNLTNNQEQQEG